MRGEDDGRFSVMGVACGGCLVCITVEAAAMSDKTCYNCRYGKDTTRDIKSPCHTCSRGWYAYAHNTLKWEKEGGPFTSLEQKLSEYIELHKDIVRFEKTLADKKIQREELRLVLIIDLKQDDL